MEQIRTYQEGRDAYIMQLLKAPETIRNYDRAIDLFIELAPKPLAELGRYDANILVRFVMGLLEEGYANATVSLYLSAVRAWFKWMGAYDFFPLEFSLTKALQMIKDSTRGSLLKVDTRAPEPPKGIEKMITYYDHASPPPHLKSERAIANWNKTRIRDRALMRVLAETGGRLSEILDLNISDFPVSDLYGEEVMRVRVRGKGNNFYDLRFLESLPAIRDYIKIRTVLKAGPDGKVPLFVSHKGKFSGQRLIRQTAWRVVTEAARALGLGKIHPHDFRHWRATRLLNAGKPLDVVQDYLGHQSVETTRNYYAVTNAKRVDSALRDVSINDEVG